MVSTREGLSASGLHYTQAFDPLHFIGDLRQTGRYHHSKETEQGKTPKWRCARQLARSSQSVTVTEKNGKKHNSVSKLEIIKLYMSKGWLAHYENDTSKLFKEKGSR